MKSDKEDRLRVVRGQVAELVAMAVSEVGGLVEAEIDEWHDAISGEMWDALWASEVDRV